jgi:putative PIN family toxin of toxin-antitoxin system
MAELQEVLFYPRVRSCLPFGDDAIHEILTQLRTSARIVSTEVTIEVMERDSDDNRVLEAAVAGSADFIVSGDKSLRARERYEGIEIITPSRFLGIMSL